MSDQLPARLPVHMLQRPNGWAILASLEKSLRSEAALAAWARGCDAAQVAWPEPQPDDAELARIVDYIVESGGLAAVIATSCRIRMKAYESLKQGRGLADASSTTV